MAMKQVSPADGLAAKIYGRGKPDPDRCYRKSLFAAEVPCEDGVIFFHTLAGSMFLLNEVDAEQLSEALLRELPLRELEHTVSAECFRTVTELIKERYLVPDDTDEIKHASEVRSMMELMMLQKETVIVCVPVCSHVIGYTAVVVELCIVFTLRHLKKTDQIILTGNKFGVRPVHQADTRHLLQCYWL